MISDIDKKKAKELNIDIQYSDDDIIIVDSIKQLKPRAGERVPVNIILLCTNGTGKVNVNGNIFEINKNDLLIMPPNTYLEDAVTSKDFECKVLCLTNSIIQSFLRPNANIWNMVFYMNKSRIRKIEAEEAGMYAKFHELTDTLKRMEDNKYKNLIMQSLIKGSILSICNALEKSVKEDYDNDSPGKTIFIKFLNLLDQNKPKRMSVAEYANQLCVTPKYLTIICKRNSERTAIEWIHKYVNDEVRYYLGQTDLSLKEITHLLNFPNVSFFGRYVKQHFGVSPKTLRQNL